MKVGRPRWLATLYARPPVVATLAARRRQREGRAEIPRSSARIPLREARVALVTSAGVHVKGDPPFDMANPDGDAGSRVIPGAVIDRRFYEAACQAGGAPLTQDFHSPWPVTIRGLNGRREIYKYVSDLA